MALGQPSMHRTFKEIKIHTAKCDQCNKHNSATIYRCEDCSEQCCTPCWNQQGEDGKHLLNHALTVTIPASEAEKRRPTKRKPTRAVTKRAKKVAITNKKVEKHPVRRKRKVVDDDELDDTEDDVDMEGGPVQVATAANKSTRINKQMKTRLQVPDLCEDSSDPDVEVGPISHFRATTQHAMMPVGSRHLGTRAMKGPAHGSREQVQKKVDVVVHEGCTTDDDLPVSRIPSKATSNTSKEFLKVGNANKRKRSGSSLEDQNTSRDHHSESSRKKARTSTPRNTGVTMDASSCAQAPMNTEETEAEIREHAKNLLLFAQGFQHSSPTPSPPITKTANSQDTEANHRPDLKDSNKARSSSPFADLPVWPPAPTSRTAAVSSTFPPSHGYHERATARQAQNQATQTPAPREGMWNRTWFPTDADDRAKATAAYHAGVNAGLDITTDARRTPPPTIEDSETRGLTNAAAVETKKTRENHACRQTARGPTTEVVIEVVETVTKSAATPLRKGIAHVKEGEHVTSGPGTLEVIPA